MIEAIMLMFAGIFLFAALLRIHEWIAYGPRSSGPPPQGHYDPDSYCDPDSYYTDLEKK